MRSNPERLAIRSKLLEVYAKRRDIKGFELLATQLFALTRGEGEEWTKAQELGSQIDPENPLYQAGGAPERPSEGAALVEPLGASTLPQSIIPVPSQYGSSVGADSAIARQPDRRPRSRPRQPGRRRAVAAGGVRRHRVVSAANRSRPASSSRRTKMPLTSNESGRIVGPDTRDTPLAFDLSGISLDLDKPGDATVRQHRRAVRRGRQQVGSDLAQAGAGRGVPAHRRQGRCPRPAPRGAGHRQRLGEDQGAGDARRPELRRAPPALAARTVVRVALGIAYRGSAYHGWQSQPGGQTVQDQLERALSRVRRPAGRHRLRRAHRCRRARAQPGGPLRHRRPSATEVSWVRGTNRYLPGDIAVQWCRPVPDAFHSRASATGRRYAYVLLESPVRPALEAGQVGWIFRPLDGDAMRAAAARAARRARLQLLPLRRVPGADAGEDAARASRSRAAAPTGASTSRPTPSCTT